MKVPFGHSQPNPEPDESGSSSDPVPPLRIPEEFRVGGLRAQAARPLASERSEPSDQFLLLKRKKAVAFLWQKKAELDHAFSQLKMAEQAATPSSDPHKLEDHVGVCLNAVLQAFAALSSLR